MTFSIGSDPEFVLLNRKNQPKSAIGVLPKKNSAKPIKGNTFYYDNVLAEIAIKPSFTKEEFLNNIRFCLRTLASILDKQSLRFDLKSSVNYPKKELLHDDARIAGCSPEWDVYSLKCILPPEEIIQKTSFRCSGGHIHVGSDLLQDANKIFNFVKMMDLFVGIPSIVLDLNNFSKERRKIYGKAGSHRITEYGLEYRTLSNFWFASPDHASLIYDLTYFVHCFVASKQYTKFWFLNESLLNCEDPSKSYFCFGYDVDSLIDCINNYNLKNIDNFLTFISHYLPENILQEIDRLSLNKEEFDPYVSWDI